MPGRVWDRLRLRLPVTDHAQLLHRDQYAVDDRFELGQESGNFRLGIDGLDHDRQILGNLQELGAMHVSVASVAHRSAQDRAARQPPFPRLLHDGAVERASLAMVALAAEDPQQLCIAGQLHGHAPESRLSQAASMYPKATASRHKTSESTMFSPARSQAPACAKASVCRLNDEKVV